MKSFLTYVAQDIIQKYGNNLSDIAIVFPNKRASLFLNEQLARLVSHPLWSPTYITISDLFRQHTTLKVGDPIKLVCDLHKSFVECTGIEETLDHFYGWGQLLIADFDDVDKNMASARQLFATSVTSMNSMTCLTSPKSRRKSSRNSSAISLMTTTPNSKNASYSCGVISTTSIPISISALRHRTLPTRVPCIGVWWKTNRLSSGTRNISLWASI